MSSKRNNIHRIKEDYIFYRSTFNINSIPALYFRNTS